MPPRDLTAIYATVTKADRARIWTLARNERQTLSQLVRWALNDYLESLDEPPLQDCSQRGRPTNAHGGD